MSIQKKRKVLGRTKLSWENDYSECGSLLDELEVKELVAYESENYCEAFVLQFSFLETKIESIVAHFARVAGVHSSTTKQLQSTWKVSDKITHIDCLLSPLLASSSRKDFHRLIDALREYNTFRNDYLHDCANPKKFTSAIHIDQALQEAYTDGLEIMHLLSKIKLTRSKS